MRDRHRRTSLRPRGPAGMEHPEPASRRKRHPFGRDALAASDRSGSDIIAPPSSGDLAPHRPRIRARPRRASLAPRRLTVLILRQLVLLRRRELLDVSVRDDLLLRLALQVPRLVLGPVDPLGAARDAEPAPVGHEGPPRVAAGPDLGGFRGRLEQVAEAPADLAQARLDVEVEVEVALQQVRVAPRRRAAAASVEDAVDLARVDLPVDGDGDADALVDLGRPEVELRFGLGGPVRGAVVGVPSRGAEMALGRARSGDAARAVVSV